MSDFIGDCLRYAFFGSIVVMFAALLVHILNECVWGVYEWYRKIMGK